MTDMKNIIKELCNSKFRIWFFIIFVVVLFMGNANYSYAEEITVRIPFGAFNPELNTPAEVWYDPPTISVNIGDTVTWINNDREGHTVTSGQSSGRFGWMNKDFGTPDGLFDSGRFMPEESWSYTFEKSGNFSYFCSIHPWMEGIVVVKDSTLDYPHDAFGNRIEKFPVIQDTPDQTIEVDLTWEPPVIKTHETVKFIYQFYNSATNTNLAKMKYDFVLIQNGKEIYRDIGLTQIGGDYRNFAFDNFGPIIIRFEGITSTAGTASEKSVDVITTNKAVRTTEFSTIVYDNPEKITHEQMQVKPAQRLEFYYELLTAIILAPAAIFIAALFLMKKKPENTSTSSSPI